MNIAVEEAKAAHKVLLKIQKMVDKDQNLLETQKYWKYTYISGVRTLLELYTKKEEGGGWDE